ncbi:anaerobic ribonucleoside-triphosphate reductase-activating protein [Virgibacillus pantothenticus]|uniref:Anaerobic ribonucleoside-triphosphate reductase-activating protein n=1 Tax=Virgibacillus pantothenticus TaxID=1473 RepID=A0A0L0QUZ5_VIRPA|nr:anaerobic ribonucleoside-triphosphate reductase activating protein [Virgibacillus pantothenticus]KNE22396.1 ribonucleoside-triphosphate reductase activating protein [Virgibacillus pantothenticus]MED3738370.1 anaerobic ribonucleoside-triphosphate reductase activating protein [Virgibacillus pantothenticus]QTY16852.1 anaerobic ribonucleoside-triphosphate reductase activating protein [Virgibacillus pantothenticus]SIS86217.1 ribonucleoside-triphosphate reductase class III activase subunit [Virgib
MDTARVLSIYHDSVVDGEGLRTVIFFAGCPHHCKGCHNPKSWNIRNGKEMHVQQIIDEALNPLTDITLSGGDPFYQAEAVAKVAKRLKEHGKNIWAYTGWTIEQLMENNDAHQLELLQYVDVLVDGPFILSQRDLTLTFRGSRNQRIIDMNDYRIH